MKFRSQEKGFTLAEVLVVVSIIGILTTVGVTSFSAARANARDNKRIADITQLKLVFRMYLDQYGPDIDCKGGLKIDGSTRAVSVNGDGCAEGDLILSRIKSLVGEVPHDPLGPGDDDHYYYFDNRHFCTPEPSSAVLFAVNLENKSANDVEAGCPAGTNNNDGGYYSTVSGRSNPYVLKLPFTFQ